SAPSRSIRGLPGYRSRSCRLIVAMLYSEVVKDVKRGGFREPFKEAVRKIFRRNGGNLSAAEIALAWACHRIGGRTLVKTRLGPSRGSKKGSTLISVELVS